jgi:predicted MFS family arabinose efflux permease
MTLASETREGLPPGDLRTVVQALCATQIVSWGTLYYTLPVLAPTIARDTGWSLTLIVASFTGSQVVSAASSVMVGRAIQAAGPRSVMTRGALLGVLGLLGVASAPTMPMFALAWAVVGASMAAVLYPPAFATLTEWGGARRVASLTMLTLVGGFASTVFAPLAAYLAAPLGWRGTYVVMASLLALTAPVLWRTLHHSWRPGTRERQPTSVRAVHTQGPVWRTSPFVRLVAALGFGGFSQWAAVFLLVPLLMERGMDTETAALALGGGGVGQVCGRLAYSRLVAGAGAAVRTRAVFAGVAASTLALALVPGPHPVLFVLAFGAGIARGVYTLVQATAVADRWGTASYASLNGIVSAALMLVAASAPWVGTALATSLGSYAVVFAILSGIAAAAILTVPRDQGPPTAPD